MTNAQEILNRALYGKTVWCDGLKRIIAFVYVGAGESVYTVLLFSVDNSTRSKMTFRFTEIVPLVDDFPTDPEKM